MNGRVRELRAWAASRITACREQENKFSLAGRLRPGRRVSTSPVPQTVIEAWTERRALQAVLRILDDEESL